MSAQQQQQQSPRLYQQLASKTHLNSHLNSHLNNHLNNHLNSQINRQQQQVPIKTANATQPNAHSAQLLQRKLLAIFYVYAAIVISVYATYAVYYLYQHQMHRKQHQEPAEAAPSEPLRLPRSGEVQSVGGGGGEELESRVKLLEQKLDKVHLLERYLDVMAIELQETRNRLREREKCDCSIGCTFNNTRYQDRSTWQNQCDICTCRLGQISCEPQKCPPLTCDDPVQLAGQCCPTCMKKCKHNNTLIKHGQRFKPSTDVANQKQQQQKECRCHDGRIKCELIQLNGGAAANNNATTKSAAQVTPQSSLRQLRLTTTTSPTEPTSGQAKKPS